MIISFEVFAGGTVVFEQLPGLRFPATAHVITTAAGQRALSNSKPGDELNRKAMTIDFVEGQSRVALKAGLEATSSIPVSATLTAFDKTGAVITQDGPRQVGPGPVDATAPFSVQASSPTIQSVELNYSGAHAELIDDLDFDVAGTAVPVDVGSPEVTVLQPQDGATLAGESFILHARITEDRHLAEALVTIANTSSTETFGVNLNGQAPDFTIGPVRVHQPLALGANRITVTARDLAGNEGRDDSTVTRVPTAATLVVPEGPIVLRRGGVGTTVSVRLEETFAGSLDGRDDIEIVVAAPDTVHGSLRIADFLNQPEPVGDLTVFANRKAQLGATTLVLEAREAGTGLVIATAELVASIVPRTTFECSSPLVPYYGAASPEEVREQTQLAMDQAMADASRDGFFQVSTVRPVQVTFADREVRISSRFRIDLGSITATAVKTALKVLPTTLAEVNLSATIVRNEAVRLSRLADVMDPTTDFKENQLPFTYQSFTVNATPDIPVLTIVHAIAWMGAEQVVEQMFSDQSRGKLIRDFNVALARRVGTGLLLLQDTRITTREFALIFCLRRQDVRDRA